MNCNEAKELFSLWLDGEMNESERELFQFHLKQCASCRLELEQWEKISSALQELAKAEHSVPAGFSSSVMQLIHQEQAIKSKSHRRQWAKTAKSGVAAAVLLAFTALGINSVPLLQVADKNIVQEKVKTHYATPRQTEQKPNQAANSSTQQLEVANNPSILSKENTVQSGNNEPEKQVAAVTAADASKSAPVFLNKERNLTTTMLKLKVADPPSVQAEATNIARTAGGKPVLLGQQTQAGQRFVILKFTVPADKSNTLLSQLSALGTQTSIQEEKQDLTARFSATLEQYRNLLEQRAKLQDNEQAAQLDKQIASLQEQLSSWDKQAQEASIVLWLEE